MLALLGCAAPVEDAPAGFEDLVLALYREQDDDDALATTVPALWTWLRDDWDATTPGWRLPTLAEDDLDGLPHPARDLDAALGGAAAAASAHTLDQHVAFVLRTDQWQVNEADYDRFERSFLEGGDCFDDCTVLRTWNDIVKNGAFGVQIPYAYEKDYRRVAFTDDGGVDRVAIVARGWLEEESLADDGANGILQSYNLDVFVTDDDGGIVRVQAQWTELLTSLGDLVTDEYLYDQLVSGMQQVFSDTDAAIDALGI